MTVCGAVDPSLPLGSLIVFDDLHFLVEPPADGSLCTFYDEPGDPLRGHWIYEEPVLRRTCAPRCSRPAGEAGVPARDGGCYGHVDGPRFNTRAEIRSLALGGRHRREPDGRARRPCCAARRELPYALLGYATDYANGVQDEADAGRGAAAPDRREHRRVRARAGGGPADSLPGASSRRPATVYRFEE